MFIFNVICTDNINEGLYIVSLIALTLVPLR